MECSVLDVDRAIVGDGPAWIVRDFPDIAVRVGKGSRCSAPIRDGSLASYGTSSALGLLQNQGDLFG